MVDSVLERVGAPVDANGVSVGAVDEWDRAIIISGGDELRTVFDLSQGLGADIINDKQVSMKLIII